MTYEASRRAKARLRQQFLDEYGRQCGGLADGTPCPESQTDEQVLTLAHLNNDAATVRKANGIHEGQGLLYDLRRRGWPKDEGIGVQCANCQLRDLRIQRGNS